MLPDFKALLTVKDLAQLCNATRKTIYRWIDAGKAPSHITMKDDRIYFYPEEAKEFASRRNARKVPRTEGDE